MVFFCTAVQAASTLSKLGNHPFFKPPLTSVEDLKYMVRKQTVAIMEGFELAGLPEFFDDFDTQFPSAKIDPIKIHKDETLKWMFYKRRGKGKVRVAKDVTWVAAEPFNAYRFFIDHAGKRYEIVVPWKCGNVALRNIGPIPAPPPKPKPPEPKPAKAAPNRIPLCGAVVSPETAGCKKEITVDASASSDPDGRVTAVLIRLEDSEGNILWEQLLDKEPFVHKFPAPCEPGEYTVRTIAIDNLSAESASGDCRTTIAVTAARLGFPVLDVGLFRIIDPATFVAARIGYEYYLTEAWSIMGLIGPYIKVGGDDSAGALTLDILLKYRFADRFFFGFGGGVWFSDGQDDKLDLIAELGVRILGPRNSTHVSLYAEARSAVNEFDDLWSAGRFGVGVRVNF